MSRAKRPYIPKAKGCYECSQRRIHCDRGEPSCDKCISKGLECSGISGQRQKFRNWVAPERKARTRPAPSCRRLNDRETIVASPAAEISESPTEPTRGSRECSTAEGPSGAPVLRQKGSCHDQQGQVEYDTFTGPEYSIAGSPLGLPIPPALDHVAPWQRFLLQHFSDCIAPEMVIIDDCNNGWRHLVLPLACTDKLVMCSVLAVAAYHFSQRVNGQYLVAPTKLYSRTIHELQQRRNLCNCDIDTRYRIIVTLVVLLVSTMVNGSSDFVIVFRMLQSALGFVGGEETLAASERDIASFSAKQIRKMRVYASPFISQDAGISAVSTQAHHCWDEQELELYHYDSLPLISALRNLAFEIYLQQASMETDNFMILPDLLLRFRLILESFPDDIKGEHVLIWPVFIAASASHIPEQRTYFAKFLKRHFLRSGFANIRKALESLQRIWARHRQEDWTALLSEQEVFVM
ncbi:hypothetical protein F5Y13DRAFT_114925 [Hypoxylon sp. FL1857]|nr:hypothetical protein F5Y13DRAFT_114925 [Hypoxylon sp. FL1857]